jgi:hypothetical protein
MQALFKTPWHPVQRNTNRAVERPAPAEDHPSEYDQEAEWLGWDGWVDISNPAPTVRSLTNH